MSVKFQILEQLGDGRFHSGQKLGELIGVSRAAVWKAVQAVESEYGLTIQSVSGRGYRLEQPLELLKADQIIKLLGTEARAGLHDIEILPLVDSTNNYLRKRVATGLSSGHVVLAEQQTAGRGRRGNQWVSPFGANLYLSLLWRFDLTVMQLAGLGIAVAVALARSLANYAPDLGIKWPNDILWRDQKLAGILLELEGEAHGKANVVVGVGVNIAMPTDAGKTIDQSWIDLSRITGATPSRQEVAARVLNGLLLAMSEYQQQGLAPFLNEWPNWDLLADKPVQLILENQVIGGIGRGIDKDGAILIDHDGKQKRYLAGEVSLRKQGQA